MTFVAGPYVNIGGPSIGGPVYIQKIIIVQRDENGYGLTVSGDNPVYVQSVKEGMCTVYYTISI